MLIYISGPMTGIPEYNRAEFLAAGYVACAERIVEAEAAR